MTGVREATDVVDNEDLEGCVGRGDVMLHVYRYAYVVHFLATWTLAYERLYVLTHVWPLVSQANQLGDCAFGATMAYDGIVTHLKCLELVIL
jgi:hypothetical protein